LPEKKRAIGEILDRWRLNEGWLPRDAASQDFEIQSYIASLDRARVPFDAYNELFERSLVTRAIAIQQGRTLPIFGVELLLAHWLGENGLAKERQIRLNGDRQLNPTCDQVCSRCLDTGRQVFAPHRGLPCDCAYGIKVR